MPTLLPGNSSTVSDVFDASSLHTLAGEIDGWLHDFRDGNPLITAVDRATDADLAADPRGGVAQWYVRMRGEAKEFTTVWLTLGQRTLRYETYVMPAPEEQHAQLYELALRRNNTLVGAHFSIGAEDGVFLRGELPLAALSEAELDRIIGSLYAYVEANFPAMIRIGFARRFADDAAG
jgi:hypothetical protein